MNRLQLQRLQLPSYCICSWLSWLAVRCIAVSDTRPVGYRLYEYEPGEHIETVACPRTALGELLRYDVPHADIHFADSNEPEESRAHTVAHSRHTRIVVPTAVAISQFV